MEVFVFVRHMWVACFNTRYVIGISALLLFSCRKATLVPPTPPPNPAPFSISYTNSLPIGTGTITNEIPKFESADIVRLKDGSLMSILSNEFYHGEYLSIYSSKSNDNGLTWSSLKLVSLANPNNYKLLNENIFYVGDRLYMIIQRTPGRPVEGGIPVISYSDDQGESWSPAHLMVGVPDRKYIIINSRNVTITRTGRIIVPVGYDQAAQKVGVIYSDNNGYNWIAGPNLIGIPGARFGEPTIAQLNDGRLMMLIRTSLNWIYQSYSSDDGINWTEPLPTTLQSPWTAHAMRVTPEGYIVVVFTKGQITGKDPGYPRNNLTVVSSLDNGSTWDQYTTIVDHTDPEYLVMAPSINILDDKILVSYLHDSASMHAAALDRSIRTVLYNKFDIITGIRQDWNDFSNWTRNGEGLAEIMNGDLLHLTDSSNFTAGVHKMLNLSNAYQFEFRAKVAQFVNPENLSNSSSLETSVGTGSFKFSLKIESDGVYALTGDGSWSKYTSPQYLNSKTEWHVWKAIVSGSSAEIYLDGQLIIPSYTLHAEKENIGIEHSTTGLSSNCFIDYSYYSPMK